jgi:phenylacetate-CoA ligase
LLENGHMLSLKDTSDYRQNAWERQSSYVTENSLFYQRLWNGTSPPKKLQEIAELPLSDKASLRLAQPASPPFGDYLAARPEKVTRLHRTSGTTGQAMNLALSARDCEITEIVGGRAQTLAGLKAGMMVVHCLNYQMWMGGLTDHLTLERTGATVVPFGVGSTELLIRTIIENGITAISCTPSYPAALEMVIAEKFPQLSPSDLGLKLGLFGGEPGIDDPAFRKRLRDTWGMQPRNANYGVTDVFCNFAAECAYDNALHFVAHDVLHAELIDPDSGTLKQFEPGNSGELVLTHLIRECQPLVRFRTGDIIRIENTEVCKCGCAGFRFRVIGRSDDMVVVRGLNMFPTMVAAVVTSFEELSGDYRIVLDAPPPYDVLPVEVELAEGIQGIDALSLRLERRFKQDLGATIRVKTVPYGTFPRTEGKTKRVLRSYQ